MSRKGIIISAPQSFKNETGRKSYVQVHVCTFTFISPTINLIYEIEDRSLILRFVVG